MATFATCSMVETLKLGRGLSAQQEKTRGELARKGNLSLCRRAISGGLAVGKERALGVVSRWSWPLGPVGLWDYEASAEVTGPGRSQYAHPPAV